MSEGRPAVSVLMLNHNFGELLQLAVDSVLGQTWRDLELVLIDNGSTDGSAERVLKRAGDARVRLVRNERNVGIPNGLNQGIDLCRGEFIALHDADDVSHPRRLELQVAALVAEPALDGVSCDARLVDAAGRPFGAWRSFHVPDDIAAYAPWNMPLNHPSTLFRAAVFSAYRYRPELDIASDFDLMARLLETHRMASLPLTLYDYRRHTGSITFARESRSLRARCAVRLMSARRRAGRPERILEMADWLRTADQKDEPIEETYRRFATQCRREGFRELACLHAALAVRQRPSFRNAWTFGANLAAATAAKPSAMVGMWKGPFWLLLKDRGFPAFPRY